MKLIDDHSDAMRYVSTRPEGLNFDFDTGVHTDTATATSSLLYHFT